MRPLIEHYYGVFPEKSYLVRDDRDFSVPDLYEFCEKESVYYVIRLKALAEELHPTHEVRDVFVAENYIEESIYQASSWLKPRRIVIQSIRSAGELFFSYTIIVTSLSKIFSPQAIVKSYKQRGTMENVIKEVKDSFDFDQMKSHDFMVNETRMMLILLAYNFTNWLRTLSFPKRYKGNQIQTI